MYVIPAIIQSCSIAVTDMPLHGQSQQSTTKVHETLAGVMLQRDAVYYGLITTQR